LLRAQGGSCPTAAHQPRKPSFRWQPGRSCTNIQTGRLNGGRLGNRWLRPPRNTNNPLKHYYFLGFSLSEHPP
jgi:hypothetical protein